MEKIYRRVFASILGRITVCVSDRGLREIRLGAAREAQRNHNGRRERAPRRTTADGRSAQGPRMAQQAVRQLQEYLAGQRKQFTIPLDLTGTDFQQKVWKALREIPYGETRSYGEIARRLGQPQAARAVGMANHANPVAIVVPCHRVIASNGSLGGYAGGLKRKSQILRLENARARRKLDR